MDCEICCEKINKSTRKQVCCPYCNEVCCLVCFIKDIDEKKWATMLKMRQKAAEKNREVRDVLEMFTNAITDLFNTFVSGDIKNLHFNVASLRDYTNKELYKISRRYNNKTPVITKTWQCN